MTLQPGNRLGNYEIIEKVGAGGMGAVYKAYQSALGRYVAIKVLPPQTAGDPSFAERFAQEARAIGKLRHSNIVTAFDFAHDGDVAFLVSEFIDGGTLADQLGTPLPLDYAMQTLTPIAAALDYAHARGIVHRDIKPQNILLTHDGMPVLTDFGLAKIVGPGSGMTQAGSLMGTAEYIAPECASGAEVAGPAADQYALGLVAYQMLVGRHPFPADNPLSALMAHVHKPVPLPSSLGVTLPPGTEAALLKALAKRPEERFARCADLVRALAGLTYLAATPFAAPSPTAQPSTPSDPPTLPPGAASATPPSVSPLLSPSAMVRPLERAAVTPPAAETVTPTVGAPTVVAAPGAAAPPQILEPAKAAKKTSWWRRKRMLIPPAILLLLMVLGSQANRGDVAGTSRALVTAEPTRRAGGGGGGATATVVATVTSAPTVSAPVVNPTPRPTVAVTPTPAPTATPTPAPTPTPLPTDAFGSTPANATPISQGFINGSIAPVGDVDWFRFNVTTLPNQIFIELKGHSPLVSGVTLFSNPTTQAVPEQVDEGNGAKISYVPTSTGSYYIRVRGLRDTTGTYTLALGIFR